MSMISLLSTIYVNLLINSRVLKWFLSDGADTPSESITGTIPMSLAFSAFIKISLSVSNPVIKI